MSTPRSPVHVVQINECRVFRGSSLSSKKNVIEVKNFAGKVVALLQCEEGSVEEWVRVLSEMNPPAMPVKALTRLFSKGGRPTRDSLEERGIYQDEPVFGSRLVGKPAPPRLLEECARVLSLPPHVTSLGLYRTSGNLSSIQKLRLEVDQGRWKAIEENRETDVLAGALKLFFRELRDPLIPYASCQPILDLIASQDDERKLLRAVKDELGRRLPGAHLKTLGFLCRHLALVCRYEEENHMNPYSLGIVWGPSLIWPAETDVPPPTAMLNCTANNQVVEYLIANAKELFIP